MMLKIEFAASTLDDIQGVARVMAGLAAALGAAPVSHVQHVSVSDTPAKRGPGRPRKSADPVEAYVAAGGTMPDNASVEIKEAEAAFVPEPSHLPITADELAASPEVKSVAALVMRDTAMDSEIAQAEATFTPASLDELRAQIRTMAQDRGALWLRPLLEADKVTKVSGLTEATMRAALAEAGQ